MKEIQLLLRPAPGAQPEFLATVRPVEESANPAARAVWDTVLELASTSSTTGTTSTSHDNSNKNNNNNNGVVVVLDDYTREGWAWKPDKTGALVTVTVESTDGRNKLPGFVQYLKQRQKSAYGRQRV